MLDKQFDHIINQKIRDAKIDVPESDWNVFSQKLKVALESTGPEDQLFDDAIKAKLTEASIATPKPEWSAFAPKLQDNLNTDISDTAFDKIINDKVSQANINTPSPDWKAFADKLDDAQFDASIKEKVENPDIEIPKPDWPIFAGLLASTMTAGHDMSDAQFDSVIQDKLIDSNVDIPSSDWSALAQKMEKAGLNDKQIDAEVKSKLENYSTRYEESHWAILREKMVYIRDLRRNLYGLKGFEAALTVLLFITFANFFADGLTKNNEPIAKVEALAMNAENASALDAENRSTLDQEKEDITLFKNNQQLNPAKASSFAISETKNNVASANNEVENDRTTSSRNSGSNNGENTNTLTKEVNSPSPSAVAPIIKEESNTEFSKIEDIIVADITKTNITPNHTITGLSDIALIGINGFATSKSNINPDFVASPMIEVEDSKAKNGVWNLYVAAGRNTHQIFTPIDTLIGYEAYSRKSNNLQFEINVAREFEDIEVMTGIAYQRMQYGSKLEERIPIAQDIDLFYSIENIKYDFIKIPLSTRWNYKISDRFGFFADLGLSANILMKSDYIINEWTEVEGTPPGTIPQPISSEVEEFDSNSDFTSTAHYLKNYQQGLIEGGSIKENILGNLDSGIGFKFKTSKGIETFARASMSQQLGERNTGPNSDSFSTWGIQLGLKYRLK